MTSNCEIFVSLVLALARALPESQPLALVCGSSKQLDSLVGFVWSLHMPCNYRPTLVWLHVL